VARGTSQANAARDEIFCFSKKKNHCIIPIRFVVDRREGRKHFFLKKRSKNFLRLGARRRSTKNL